MVTRTGYVRALVLGLMTVAGTVGAAQQVKDMEHFEPGASVTLQGCVIAGERDGSFVFSRVTVWPVVNSPMGLYGPRHFWLENAASQLAAHLNETIQVTGTIAARTESEVEREPGFSPVGNRVAIELPTGDVFTSPGLAGIPVSQLGNSEDMKITLIKVHIDSLLVVMKKCLPRM